MLSYTTHSPAETHALAKRIGAAVKPGTCIAFFAGMGAGKTTFTRGLAEGIGLPDLVSSPTFALVNEYHAAGCTSVYHFDMYRVNSPEALETTGGEYRGGTAAAARENHDQRKRRTAAADYDRRGGAA